MADAKPTEPTLEEIAKVLKKRFWILSIILLVVNGLSIFFGKPLMEYQFEQYVENKLATWEDVVEKAKVDARAASQQATNANDKATNALEMATTTASRVNATAGKADALQTRIDQFDERVAMLANLQVEISAAKRLLGDQKQIDERIDGKADKLVEKMNDEIAKLRTDLSAQQNRVQVRRFTHKLNDFQTPKDIDFGQPVEKAEVVLSGIWLQRRSDEAGDFGWRPTSEVKGNVVRVTFPRMGLGGHDASAFDMTIIAWLK
jgi:vacuolar-type H+-ATPase subunit I/STV1